MRADFFSAERVHVLLNHLPITGLAMAIIALGLALNHHSRKVEIVALILVLISSASAWPVNLTGHRAYKPMRGLVDDAGADWLDSHMERAERSAPAFYALAVLAAASLAVPHKWPRMTRPLAISSFILALLCFAVACWIADAGGAVRHPEFRRAQPSRESPADHTHDHH